MSKPNLKLMLSSRCAAKFPIGDEKGSELSDIRRKLKKDIEGEKFFGKSLVDVWINETETAHDADTSWDACIEEASDCDIFIAILDGFAGNPKDNDSVIGMCHAEFEEAHAKSPGKVGVINLIDDTMIKPGRDSDFVDAVKKANLFDVRKIKNVDELKKRTKELVRELILRLSHEGAREVKKSGPNTGQALDWSRLNFLDRQKKMVDVLKKTLDQMSDAITEDATVIVPINKKTVKVLFQPSAIPSAFSVSAAREMVGQPFLSDYKLSGSLKTDRGGPVHVIACQKNITEAQARKFLGFPDATIVPGSFGVYVADNIQKIQLILISHCIDEASTKHGLQKLFEWLERTGEDKLLAKRAQSRAKILKAIAGELE